MSEAEFAPLIVAIVCPPAVEGAARVSSRPVLSEVYNDFAAAEPKQGCRPGCCRRICRARCSQIEGELDLGNRIGLPELVFDSCRPFLVEEKTADTGANDTAEAEGEPASRLVSLRGGPSSWRWSCPATHSEVGSSPRQRPPFQDAGRLVHAGEQLLALLGTGEGQHVAAVVLGIPQPAAKDGLPGLRQVGGSAVRSA